MASLASCVLGKASIVINVDFRVPRRATFAYRDGFCVVELTDPNEFVRALQRLAKTHRLVTFNGSNYVFPPLMGVVDPELIPVVAELAWSHVDIMALFFLDHGYPVGRRRIGVASLSEPTAIRFACLSKSRFDHKSVTSEVLALDTTLARDGRLRWVHRKHARDATMQQHWKVWTPSSMPTYLTLSAAMMEWASVAQKPAIHFGDGAPPTDMEGGVIPAILFTHAPRRLLKAIRETQAIAATAALALGKQKSRLGKALRSRRGMILYPGRSVPSTTHTALGQAPPNNANQLRITNFFTSTPE
jgi:hypothetical protein